MKITNLLGLQKKYYQNIELTFIINDV